MNWLKRKPSTCKSHACETPPQRNGYCFAHQRQASAAHALPTEGNDTQSIDDMSAVQYSGEIIPLKRDKGAQNDGN